MYILKHKHKILYLYFLLIYFFSKTINWFSTHFLNPKFHGLQIVIKNHRGV